MFSGLLAVLQVLSRLVDLSNIGALIIRLRCWGPLYYNHNKEPPKQYR